jgi:hypothetical protein
MIGFPGNDLDKSASDRMHKVIHERNIDRFLSCDQDINVLLFDL